MNDERINQTGDTNTAISPTSAFIIQRQNIIRDVPQLSVNNAYRHLAESQQRMTRLPEEKENHSTGHLLIPNISNVPAASKIDKFPTRDDRPIKHRLKAEFPAGGDEDEDDVAMQFRSAVQIETRVPEDIEGLYGKINPSTKTKVRNQVNSNTNPSAGVKEDHAAISKNSGVRSNSGPVQKQTDTRRTLSGCQIPPKIKDTPSPPRSRLPRTDIGSQSFTAQHPERSENQPRYQHPLADSDPATYLLTTGPTHPIPQPSTYPADDAKERFLPKKSGRNQATVGHRMLRDVIKGKNRFHHQTPLPIEGKPDNIRLKISFYSPRRLHRKDRVLYQRLF